MKHLVTEYHALHIKKLSRGWLYPFSRYDWVWRTNKETHQTAVSIIVLEQALRLTYPMGPARVQQDISLTYSVSPRGGKRPWFLCPTCRQRVGILYHVTGLPFRCRACCDLAYPSQYRSHNQSYGRHHREVSIQEQERLTAQCEGA